MNKKLHRLNIITAALIAAVILMSLFISIMIYLSLDFTQYDNTLRLFVQDQKNSIEKGVYTKGSYPYIVFDLSGKVMYADDEFNKKEQSYINVQETLQYDKSFAKEYNDYNKENFILQKAGTTYGFVVFLIPKSEQIYDTAESKVATVYLPLVLGIIISFILIGYRTFYCNYRILKPLKEISASAKGIIAGNYNLEILRSYWKRANENEVGDLSYAFELMRDELKAKQIKEEALKKSQKELISCISHDLKTPIATIKAYSEGLRDQIAKTPEQQAEFTGIIINKTDLLTDMINDLLTYSNAQLNQLEINRQEIYFLDYFNPLMLEVKIYVEQNGFVLNYVTNLPNLIVTIDPKRITEVIYNLIENSMKYIGDKPGKILIEAECDERYVLIKVKDNGPGISTDDIPYIFDKFYRAEKSRSSSIPGSGLGLSICKYIINQHGGEIYCKSSHKHGCEIGFTIE